MLNSIEDILDVGVSSEKELDLNSNSFVRSDMDKYKLVLEYATEAVTEWFKKGEGLEGNKLRGYTAGNWIDKKNDLKHLGFEGMTKKIIDKALEVYNLTDRSKVNMDYFVGKIDGEEHESQRLDWHIWIDDKVVILEENRAWLDKPFYLQKRAVVRRFMKLPYCKKHLSDDIVFIFHTLQRDIKDASRRTADLVDGYGETIVECNLSGWKRKAKEYNYFDNGVDYQELSNYINTLCEVFEKYEK
jgi:hypothetical protein